MRDIQEFCIYLMATFYYLVPKTFDANDAWKSRGLEQAELWVLT